MRCAACRAEIAEGVTRCPRCDEPVSLPAGGDLDDARLGAPPRLGCGALVLAVAVLFVLLALVGIVSLAPTLGRIR